MTGLDLENDTILEIAAVVTDNSLNIIAEGPSLVIHHDQAALDKMNEWCIKHHTASNLVADSLASITTTAQAEHQILEFLKSCCPPGKSPICGNSVWVDRLFIQRYMPTLAAFFHYRMIDVSSLKECARRWYPNDPNFQFKKQELHRAMPDIYESIDELRLYKDFLFVPPQEYTT
jgi:oligoribonuclease